jgi:hypothetical protein
MDLSHKCVVIAAVTMRVVRPFGARLRTAANTLWPWDDKEFAACDVDPVVGELTDTSACRQVSALTA